MALGLEIGVLGWEGISSSWKWIRSLGWRHMALEGQDEEVELGSTGKEGRMKHDWDGEEGGHRVRLQMLPKKFGKSLGRHVLLWEPGHISALGIRSYLESADGKAGIRPSDDCFMGCQSCWLGKVSFVKDETAFRNSLAPVPRAVLHGQRGLFGRLADFVFKGYWFKVILFSLVYSDTQSTVRTVVCEGSHFNFKESCKLWKRETVLVPLTWPIAGGCYMEYLFPLNSSQDLHFSQRLSSIELNWQKIWKLTELGSQHSLAFW